MLGGERTIVLFALVGVTATAWVYLFMLPQDMAMAPMHDMPDMDMAMPFSATAVFAMWWIMMLGMMLPSAAPMILTFATVQQRRRERARVPVTMFVVGYLIVWGVFSLVATGAQWELRQRSLLPATPMSGGILFILAGVYQLTPLKYACLSHCRSPFAFVINHWLDGRIGALRMGTSHGLYCLGCCWVLMALLFAVGVMNLVWVAAIAAFVFAAKLLPGGVWISRIGGGAKAVFGAWLLVG